MVSAFIIYLLGCILLHTTELLKAQRSILIDKNNIFNDFKAAKIITYGRILLWPMIALAIICLIPSIICIAFEIYIQELYPIDLTKERTEDTDWSSLDD